MANNILATITDQFGEFALSRLSGNLLDPGIETIVQKHLGLPDSQKPLSMFAQWGFVVRNGGFTGPTAVMLEEGTSTRIMQIKQFTTAGPGLPGNFSLDGPYGVNGNANFGSWLRNGFKVTFGNNIATGVLSNVNKTVFPHTFTVTPLGDSLPSMPLGTNMMLLGQSVGEGAATTPYAMTTEVVAYTTEAEHHEYRTAIKDFQFYVDQMGRVELRGGAETMMLPARFKGTSKSIITNNMRMFWEDAVDSVGYTQMLGIRDTNTARVPGAAGHTDGVWPAIEADGNVFDNPNAPLDIPYFQGMARGFRDSYDGSRNKKIVVGNDLKTKFDALVWSKTENGNRAQDLNRMVYGATFLDGVAGMNFELVYTSAFDALDGLGALGFELNGLILPPATEMVTEMLDGHPRPSIEMMFGDPIATGPGVAGGAIKTGYQLGTSFVGDGEPVTSNTNEMVVILTAYFMNKIRSLGKMAVILP